MYTPVFERPEYVVAQQHNANFPVFYVLCTTFGELEVPLYNCFSPHCLLLLSIVHYYSLQLKKYNFVSYGPYVDSKSESQMTKTNIIQQTEVHSSSPLAIQRRIFP